MEVLFAALADATNISEDGKLNLLGVVNAIKVSPVPYRLPTMDLVLVVGEPMGVRSGEHTLQLVFRNQDGNKVGAFPPIEFNMEDANVLTASINLVLQLNELVIPTFSRYFFEVIIDGEGLKHVPLPVFPIAEAQPDQEPE